MSKTSGSTSTNATLHFGRDMFNDFDTMLGVGVLRTMQQLPLVVRTAKAR